jgi:rhodanese-related sulfurtransferase
MRKPLGRIIATFLMASLMGFATANPAKVPAESTPDVPCGRQKAGVLVDLTAGQGKAFIQDCEPLILDVRTVSEYRAGHIPGAKLFPLQDLEKRVAELKFHQRKPVLIYCRSGNRSRMAARILKYFGFVQLHHLDRGILQWRRLGYSLQGQD